MTSWNLRLHAQPVAVVRLAAGTDMPEWVTSKPAPLVSVTYTAAETSIVCAADVVPPGVEVEGPFRAFEVAGPLAFSLAGVLSALLEPLAEDGVSVFTLSTYDTDWILVPADRAGAATEALRRRTHVVTTETSADSQSTD